LLKRWSSLEKENGTKHFQNEMKTVPNAKRSESDIENRAPSGGAECFVVNAECINQANERKFLQFQLNIKREQ